MFGYVYHVFTSFCLIVFIFSDWELFGLLSIEWNSDFLTPPWWLQSDGGVWGAVPAASSRGPTGWRLMKKWKPRISSSQTPVQLRST